MYLFLKSNNFPLFFLLLFSVLILSNCIKEEQLDSNLEEESVSTERNSDEYENEYDDLFEYARLLSLAITKNNGMNRVLQSKSLLLEKEGYYEQEFFVGMEGDVKTELQGGKSLHEILKQVGNASTPLFIDNLMKRYPGMAVLLIGEPKVKQFSNRVYVDNAFDDMNEKEIIYYYENGRLNSHTVSEVPIEKAFIVRISESFLNSDNDEFNVESVDLFQLENGSTVKVKKSAFPESRRSTPNRDTSKHGDVASPRNGPCERDCENGTTNLWRFRTTNDYDGGFRGKGEWFFLAVWDDAVSYNIVNGGLVVTGNALEYLKTGEIGSVRGNDEWHNPDFSLFIWDQLGDGDRMKVACYESDGGSTKTVTLNLSSQLKVKVAGVEYTGGLSGTHNFVINNGDDFIGEMLVEYCHGIGANGFIYHPASPVDFQLNER